METTTEPGDTRPHVATDPAPVEWARVLEDWVTIWQSEMAGLAVDREVGEAFQRAGDLWAAQARAAAGVLAPVLQAAAGERARGPAGADAAAGAAAVAAAPDGRDAVIDRLAERVAELERRVGAASPSERPGTGDRPGADRGDRRLSAAPVAAGHGGSGGGVDGGSGAAA